MAGKRGDHLTAGERGHLAQKGYLVRDVVEDAHGNAHIELILEIQLEKIGLNERAPVGDLVLLRLLGGEFQRVVREIYANDVARATPREVGRIHTGPASNVKDLLAPVTPQPV